MLNCKKIKTYLIRDSKTLSKRQQKIMEKHLQHCRECQYSAHHLANLSDSLKKLKNIQAPSHMLDDLWKNVRNRLIQELHPAKEYPLKKWYDFRRKVSWGIPVTAAVCTIILIMIFKPWTQLSKPNAQNHYLAVTIESVEIDNREADVSVFEIQNPDMTFIWLEKSDNSNGG